MELWLTILQIIGALLAGLVFGGFYFWGLWKTVNRLPEAPRPHVTVMWSYFLRLGVTLIGFYLVMWGDWLRLVAALTGFMVMRAVLVRRWGERRPAHF
ncbi:MAG: ATP synthase subunit I [Syntrophaceae bacterium]